MSKIIYAASVLIVLLNNVNPSIQGVQLLREYIENGVVKTETVQPPWGRGCSDIYEALKLNQRANYTVGNRTYAKGMLKCGCFCGNQMV